MVWIEMQFSFVLISSALLNEFHDGIINLGQIFSSCESWDSYMKRGPFCFVLISSKLRLPEIKLFVTFAWLKIQCTFTKA